MLQKKKKKDIEKERIKSARDLLHEINDKF